MRLIRLFMAWLGLIFTAAAALAQAPAAPPPPDPANVLTLDLSNGGQVKLLLRPDKAPYAVDRLRTLSRRGFYDGLIFHRVIAGFMAQGGDPKRTGEGGSELPDLKAEFNDLPHVRGTISMARSQSPDSANSQFFIMLAPNLRLDGRYTAIGRVIAGMQYVDAIEKGEPPANPTRIVKAMMPEGPSPPPAPVTEAPSEATPEAKAVAPLPVDTPGASATSPPPGAPAKLPVDAAPAPTAPADASPSSAPAPSEAVPPAPPAAAPAEVAPVPAATSSQAAPGEQPVAGRASDAAAKGAMDDALDAAGVPQEAPHDH